MVLLVRRADLYEAAVEFVLKRLKDLRTEASSRFFERKCRLSWRDGFESRRFLGNLKRSGRLHLLVGREAFFLGRFLIDRLRLGGLTFSTFDGFDRPTVNRLSAFSPFDKLRVKWRRN